MRNLTLILGVIALAGCSGVGPSASAISSASEASVVAREKTEAFALIEVDSSVAERLAALSRPDPKFFTNVSPGPAVIGTGDTVQVSIVSTSQTGFLDFTSSSVVPISTVDLPPQEVSQTGTINVPPLGRVLARGKTLQQFETFLTRRLSEVLISPSVVVTLTDRQSARVNLIGDVGSPGARPMNSVDMRLIDVLVSGGGPAERTDNLVVRLSRRGQSASVPLQTLFENQRYNIFVLPGDVISVETPLTEMVVLGASQDQKLSFTEPHVTLAEALASAGGLVSRRANRKGVFLYRQLSREAANALGADTSRMPGATIPTIFRFDFTDPSVMFVASKFEIRDGDILYVSNSLSEEINAVVDAFSPFATPDPVRVGGG